MSMALEHPTAYPSRAPAGNSRIHRIWPAAFVAIGLALCAAWTCFLVYWIIQVMTLV